MLILKLNDFLEHQQIIKKNYVCSIFVDETYMVKENSFKLIKCFINILHVFLDIIGAHWAL